MKKNPKTKRARQTAPAHQAPIPALAPTAMRPAVSDNSDPGRWAALLLGLMMLMAPAMGVPSEEMLQDTLKSILVAFFTLGAALAFFWFYRPGPSRLTWHGLMALPMLLCAYALGSMAWSHTFLAGVEAVRWMIFGLLLWLGMNLSRHNFETRVLWGIHWGATVASLWTILQFWVDFNLFPQGPNPASTFVNRNFFAEFAVCTLPFSLYLLIQSPRQATRTLLASTMGLIVTAIMMAGTRSALIALVLAGVFLLAVVLRLRSDSPEGPVARPDWRRPAAIFAAVIVVAGLIPTGNPKLVEEFGSINAITRAAARAGSMAQAQEYTSGSFSVRSVMWIATGRMIRANPVTGVGAGAWEVQAPLYQNAGTQLETDFYAHNEILQLLAEYGLAGWLFLVLLLAYLAASAWKTWSDRSDASRPVRPLRIAALASLMMLLVVSNAGFPWRMAATGAIFALGLSVLAATDRELGYRSLLSPRQFSLGATGRNTVLATLVGSTLLACYITQRAVESERLLVRGIKLALTISKSGSPNHPHWDKTKVEMLDLMRRGIAENRHYRKLTPMAADELASWGDWKNALWIWSSVLESRPNVVALVSNIARAHLEAGNLVEAERYLDRARALQPTAPAVRSLTIMMLVRSGRDAEAKPLIRQLMTDNLADYDAVYAAYLVGNRTQDWPLVVDALQYRIRRWPSEAVDGWLKLGQIFDQKAELRDEARALEAFRAAVAASGPAQRQATLQRIPLAYRDRI